MSASRTERHAVLTSDLVEEFRAPNWILWLWLVNRKVLDAQE